MIFVDDKTFGDTPAAVSLARILSETDDIKSLSKVGRSLANFNELLRELTKVNKDHRYYLAEIALRNLVQNEHRELPVKVESYFKNCVKTAYKKWFNKHQGITKNKNRTQ